jgi:hypothetical protein
MEMDSEYYAEIDISIDGWSWNVLEATRAQRADTRRPNRFPSADRLYRLWIIQSRQQSNR